ncbi:MAG: SdpI family protein [Lachnospiraceae bacterium]|nr:SdpI family protein [Lachnospiraceae bacterium]
MLEILINAVMVLFAPILFIIAGAIQKNHPPKNINRTVGFRTALSMESQEAWDYANKQIGVYWVKVGIVELIVSVIAVILLTVLLKGMFTTTRMIATFIMVIEVMGAMIPVNMVNKELMQMKKEKSEM